MAGEPVITIVGNLTADPELRFTASGQAVSNFTVASTPRSFNRQSNEWTDGEALFVRCSVWRESAENVAESLTKGARVIVQGRLRARTFETRDGDQRTNWELDVDEVGPSLRFATAQVTRTPRGGGSQGGFGGGQGGGQFNNPPQQGGGGYGGGQPQGGNGGWGGGNPGGPGNQDPWGGATSSGAWDTPRNDEPPF